MVEGCSLQWGERCAELLYYLPGVYSLSLLWAQHGNTQWRCVNITLKFRVATLDDSEKYAWKITFKKKKKKLFYICLKESEINFGKLIYMQLCFVCIMLQINSTNQVGQSPLIKGLRLPHLGQTIRVNSFRGFAV